MARTKVSRYVVDLRSQQAECEANYVRIQKLTKSTDDRQQWEYHLEGDAESLNERIAIKVLDEAPYTSTLEVKQLDASQAWAEQRVARVRLYHDARMAEVVSWNGHWNTRSRYPYPNRKMYHRDEKFQLNRFLGEWLAQCLTHGRVIDRVRCDS